MSEKNRKQNKRKEGLTWASPPLCISSWRPAHPRCFLSSPSSDRRTRACARRSPARARATSPPAGHLLLLARRLEHPGRRHAAAAPPHSPSPSPSSPALSPSLPKRCRRRRREPPRPPASPRLPVVPRSSASSSATSLPSHTSRGAPRSRHRRHLRRRPPEIVGARPSSPTRPRAC